MKNFNKLTIIIITYRSDKIIYDFIEKIPNNIKTIIVENSQNIELKKKIEDKFLNTSVFLKKNNGFSSAFNLAVKKVETDYFIHLSPDILLDFNDMDVLFEYAEKLDNKFSVLGPRFINTKKRGLHERIRIIFNWITILSLIFTIHNKLNPIFHCNFWSNILLTNNKRLKRI